VLFDRLSIKESLDQQSKDTAVLRKRCYAYQSWHVRDAQVDRHQDGALQNQASHSTTFLRFFYIRPRSIAERPSPCSIYLQ
jgi:hypothetical protein